MEWFKRIWWKGVFERDRRRLRGVEQFSEKKGQSSSRTGLLEPYPRNFVRRACDDGQISSRTVIPGRRDQCDLVIFSKNLADSLRRRSHISLHDCNLVWHVLVLAKRPLGSPERCLEHPWENPVIKVPPNCMTLSGRTESCRRLERFFPFRRRVCSSMSNKPP